jgi:hypothetical protein
VEIFTLRWAFGVIGHLSFCVERRWGRLSKPRDTRSRPLRSHLTKTSGARQCRIGGLPRKISPSMSSLRLFGPLRERWSPLLPFAYGSPAAAAKQA